MSEQAALNLFSRIFYKTLRTVAVRRDLTSTAKIIFAAISWRVGENDCAWPGIDTIAADAGVSRRSTIRALKQLRKRGLVSWDRGNGTANKYSCHPGTSANMAPVSKRHSRGAKTALEGVSKRHSNKNQRKDSRRDSEKRSPAAPDPRVTKIIEYFCEKYKQQVGQAYSVSGGKDGSNVKRLLRAIEKILPAAEQGNGEVFDEAKRAIDNMFYDDWGNQNATLSVLFSQRNKWLRDPAVGKNRGSRLATAEPATDLSGQTRHFENED